MGILVLNMSGDTLRFRAKGWTIGRSDAGLEDSNDVFVTFWHKRLWRGLTWLLITTTQVKMEPLANRHGREKKSKCGISNKWRTHGYDEQHSRAEAYAHMNNGQFETTAHATGSACKYGYIINCWNNRRTQPLTRPAGVKSWVRSELVLRQDLPESFVRNCATGGKMMMLSVVLSIGLRLTRWYWKYQSGQHELTNDMMKRAERGKNCGPSKSKPDRFSTCRGMSTWWAVLDW